MMNAEDAPIERFRLATLGGFALLQRDQDASDGWSDAGLGEKSCALLAYLIWRAAAVPRAALAEVFWEGVEQSRARNSLRQALFRIRCVLGSTSVVDAVGGIRLAIEFDIDLPSLRQHNGSTPAAASTPTVEEIRTFGRSNVIRGRAFSAWCAQVRGDGQRIESRTNDQFATTRMALPNGHANGSSRRGRFVAHADAAVDWLGDLWQLSTQGIPVSAWLEEAGAFDARQVIDVFARECRADGGRVAQLKRNGRGYLPFSLERDIAALLWEMPGAAGVLPEHREAIEQVTNGEHAPSPTLRTAILDLIAAVAEDAPLLLSLEGPERYSLGALRGLVSGLTMQSECPVLLLIAARPGSKPVSPLCISLKGERRGARPTGRGEAQQLM